MKVWLLQAAVMHEDSWIMGVFTSREKAEAAIGKVHERAKATSTWGNPEKSELTRNEDGELCFWVSDTSYWIWSTDTDEDFSDPFGEDI